MLLGSILLALAWAALQGEITLANLVVGYLFGYVILALLARGGVMPSTLASRMSHCLASMLLYRIMGPSPPPRRPASWGRNENRSAAAPAGGGGCPGPKRASGCWAKPSP